MSETSIFEKLFGVKLSNKQAYSIVMMLILLMGGLTLPNSVIEQWFNVGERITRDTIREEIEAYIDLGLGGSPYQTEKAHTFLVSNLTVSGTVYTYALNGSSGKLDSYNANKNTFFTNLMAGLTAGSVFCKEVNYDTTVAIPANVLVYQEVNGVQTWYDDTGLININQPGSNHETPNYILFTDGARYYAKSGITGEIEYSNTAWNGYLVFQYAIDATDNAGAAQYGGMVFIKRGVYIINQPIELKDHLVLMGEAQKAWDLYRGTTLLQGDSNTKGVLRADGDYFVRVTNLGIYGASGLPGGSGIFGELHNSDLDHLHISKFKFSNIHMYNGSTSVRISDNIFGQGNYSIIYMGNLENTWGADDCIISNNFISGYKSGGATTPVGIMMKCTFTRVTGNHFAYCGDAIRINGSKSGNVISNNEIETYTGNAIQIDGYSRTTVINANTINGNHPDQVGSAILFNVPSGKAQYNVITSNAFYNHTVHVIEFNLAPSGAEENNTIAHNTFRKCGAVAITGMGGSPFPRDNMGFVTENWGNTTIANGGVITHGLASTPTYVYLTVQETDSSYSIQVNTVSTTQIVIYLYDNVAGAAEATPKRVHWYAVYDP